VELKRRSVAYVVSNFPCYSETFVLSELVELGRRGVDVTIFSLRGPREKLVQDEARPLLAHTFYSPFLLSGSLLFANLYFLFKRPGPYIGLLREIITGFIRSPRLLLKNLAIWPKSVHFAYFAGKRGIDHVHAHFANYPATAAMITARLLGITYTFMSHAHDLYVDHTMVGRKIELAKHTFTISRFNKQFILERFPELPPRKIEVLGASIDTGVFAPGEERAGGGSLDIVAVGRLFPKKGFGYLIEACPYLRRAAIRFRCHIVGEGPEGGALNGLIDRLDLRGSVVMEGALMREGVMKLLREADIFVCPSVLASDVEILDGIPVVLMEAMAMGIPVVATRVSGIPELVVDGETGLLVDPADARGIAEAVVRISRETSLRPGLARRGREIIMKRHDVRKNVARLMEVFFD